MLEYYKSLPDYISTSRLKELFEELVTKIKLQAFSVEEALEALLELSDRQWHAYELLDNNLKNEIENWILSNWNKESINDVEFISSIIGRLGLTKAYKYMKSLLNENLRNEIRSVIEEAIADLDGHVEDPYFGMK
ncbi:hypothetical protein MHH56_19065 [Paenibacillus sp. FSL K6-3182]|uniref:hypothetical protein n=1 Tax=unclassified Paenibacillus TaxID=185978 RepID=UPI0030CABC07